MTDTDDDILYEGPSVEFRFTVSKPNFGDLLAMVGVDTEEFPASAAAVWSQLASLGFEQADDYFAIPGVTDDYMIWLYPIVDEQVVEHHAGPFDALRLQFNVLRNQIDAAQKFYDVVTRIGDATKVAPYFVDGEESLGLPVDVALLRTAVDEVVAHWKAEGIEPGSDDALTVDV